MGFKSMASYNDEKYGNFFRLQNDGDYADVIFLYRNTSDVMMADTHYVKSDEYSGYVTCCGKGCPACRKGVRVQSKLFVPLFIINTSDCNGIINRIQFWDRTMKFQPQLLNDVFRGYPNPSEFIFRITRHGVAGDVNTRYEIRAIQANTLYTYDSICSQFSVTFPDYYHIICKEVNMFELDNILSSSSSDYPSTGNASFASTSYGAVPRGSSTISSTIPGTEIPYTSNAPDLSMPTVSLNTTIPDSAPDPNNIPFEENDLPFGDGSNATSSISNDASDPLETSEDIDTTNLNF